MRRALKSLAMAAVWLAWCVPVATAAGEPAVRPAAWAQPLAVPGVPNLHKISDSLYRSAQPTAAGMRQLEAMGIRTVINLRSFHSDRDAIGDAALASEQITMKAWHPEEKELVRFLRLVTTPAALPALVHCQHGADRTGLMCAVYRLVVCGWTRQEALREMTEGGFGYHEVWVNLPRYLESLDIASLRRQAGLPPTLPAASPPTPPGP